MKKISKANIDRVNSFLRGVSSIDNVRKLEELIGLFTLEIIDDVEKSTMSASEADDIFAFLDEDDSLSNTLDMMQASKLVEDLFFEGQILHDFGAPHGADITKMKKIAQTLIGA